MSTDVFFTSDLHFSHSNIIKYCPDRGKRWPQCHLPSTYDKEGQQVLHYDIEAMNEALVERWNTVVRPNDTVHIVGDLAFGSAEKNLPYLRRLNGKLHFTMGNHDNLVIDNAEVRSLFVDIKDYREIRIAKSKIVLAHFPFLIWNKAHHGAWHLHGHCHGSLQPEGRRVDIGIDAPFITGQFEHRPFHYDEVAAFMKDRQMVIHDHHSDEDKR